MERTLKRIYGVDFSGARDAGRKAWVATGTAEGEMLRIEDCYSAAELPGSAVSRDQCLAALRHFIGRSGSCVIGLDFPFGLPFEIVAETTWVDFILRFKDRYASPEQFRNSCLTATRGKEPRRNTDKESCTPFSPFNLRLYRQTYFGINDLLAPLVHERQACVLPIQQKVQSLPWLIEICPASTLKRRGLYCPPYASYKGKTEEHRAAREHILKKLDETHAVRIATPELRSRILDNRGGDALDSVVAALATFRALQNDFCRGAGGSDDHLIEGYVYV